jgi:sugar lactone lactonase YvrE
VTSQVATLAVGIAPTIATLPIKELAWVHSNALFSVAVKGNGPFGYQWQFNGSNLTDDIIETLDSALNEPGGIAVDSVGNIYVADSHNYRVQKVGANGVISTVAGGMQQTDTGDGGPAIFASLAAPYAVALDPFGNLYIGELSRIRKIDINGIISTAAGTSTPGYSGDGGPAINAELYLAAALACDSAGNLFIAELINNRIRKIDGNGIITTVAGTGIAGFGGDNVYATIAELNQPDGVTVDAAGNIYISDASNYRIRKVGTNGVISTIAGTGSHGFSGDNGPATAAQLYLPAGLAIDAAGNLYLADSDNNRIRKISTNGIISTVAGSSLGYFGDGGAATNARLFEPSGVAFDTVGNLYIVRYSLPASRPSCCQTFLLPMSAITVSPSPACLGP